MSSCSDYNQLTSEAQMLVDEAVRKLRCYLIDHGVLLTSNDSILVVAEATARWIATSGNLSLRLARKTPAPDPSAVYMQWWRVQYAESPLNFYSGDFKYPEETGI